MNYDILLNTKIEDNKEFNFDLMQSEIKSLGKRLESMLIEQGTEGIMTRLSVSIADIFIKLVLNIKSSITEMFKDLRRSELQSYIQAHLTACTLIRNGEYSKFANTEIAIFPFNEEKFKVINTTNNLIELLNFTHRVKTIHSILINLYSGILNDNQNEIRNEIKKLSNISDISLSNNIFNFIKKNENVQLEKTTPFGKMYSSMKEFNEYLNTVLINENTLNDCVGSVDMIEKKIYPVLEEIVKVFVKDPDKLKEFKNPEELSQSIYDIAYFMDAAGHIFKHYSHIEHNLTNAFKVLKGSL